MGRGSVLRPFRFVGLQRSRRTLDHRSAFAYYDCLMSSVKNVVRTPKATVAEGFGGEPYSIVAHFLGGAVSFCLAADGEPVEQIFTMSSSFGGSKAAIVLNMAFCLTSVFPDINPLGSTIRSVRQEEITVPLRSMVTTSGGAPR